MPKNEIFLEVQKKASNFVICFPTVVSIPRNPTDEDFKHVVETLLKEKRAKGNITFKSENSIWLESYFTLL